MAKSLKVVKEKMENAFSQIQMIYDLTKKTSDKDVLQKFLIRAKSANKLRQEFSDALDLYNELELATDPQFKPNYTSLNSADELVDYINANLISYESKMQSKSKSEPPSVQTSVVRLPKLELKHFKGEPLEWVSFINLFDSSIHKNSSLSPSTKFQYLLSVLSGDALSLVNSLPISDSNYTVAYDLLKERYHSPRRLITLHLNQILDLPSVNHSPKQMRKFVNSYNENIQALKGLKIDITQKNPLLSAMVLRKMDSDLRKRFEHFRSYSPTVGGEEDAALPDIADIIKFLNQDCNEIENASLHSSPSAKPVSAELNYDYGSKTKPSTVKKVPFGNHKVSLMACNTGGNKFINSKPLQCFVCHKTDHTVYKCPIFKSKDPKTRFQIVKENKRCSSCLGNHNLNDCRSTSSCFSCHKRHHSLLHFEENQEARSQTPLQTSQGIIPAVTLTCQDKGQSTQRSSTVLLGTLLVKLTSASGITHVFRALADSGSQSCFITEQAAQLLCAKRTKSPHCIAGLSHTITRSKGHMYVNIETLSGKMISKNQGFLILDKICVDLPRVTIAPEVFNMVQPYVLADPTFHMPGGIDILLGGSVFPLMLTQVAHHLGSGLPSLVGSHFGFLVMGDTPCAPQDSSLTTHMSTLLAVSDIDLHNSVQRFWQQEEPPVVTKQSEEDKLCENHFLTTYSRDQSGRYCVRLPFKIDHPHLGHSLSTAENRLSSLERKFQVQPQFKSLYSDFMTDYSTSGHMEIVEDIDLTAPHYFLPHHGVLKESSSTTRLRTVFDASSKSSNGLSLNDILLTGRKMQTNICDLLLIFRKHKFVFSCDIRQMYRQIRMHPDDQYYQLIRWRDNLDQPVSTFKLTTVTYGVKCSPYHAIRTLHQLATDEGESYPAAAEILRTQTFVDDIIAGGDSEDEARQLQQQLISLLQLGGFELRKWTSNSSQLLIGLPDDHLETPKFLQESTQPHFTILGLYWSPSTDSFMYNLNLPRNSKTKREILSVMAQIYDPCGFLSPIVMWVKRFMQLLWTKGLAWDQTLPDELLDMWQGFINTSESIREIIIPRTLQISQSCDIELHGFSDASENGYAAVIFLRCKLSDGSVIVRQLLSKTRVAPLKKLTIPRLELSAAHLLAQLVAYVISIFSEKITSSITLWCDSTVTLTWLLTPTYRLKTFVANRVAQVQELVPSHCWRHITSDENPADCASRGILPSELIDHDLWWFGPSWLQLPRESWPEPHFVPAELSETGESKPLSPITLLSTAPQEWDLLTKFSDFNKLQRVMAYTLRFIHNLRHKKKSVGPLTTSELLISRLKIFKTIQEASFKDDIAVLRRDAPRLLSTSLRRLSPFIDKEGILRVGGRLSASQYSVDIKHPLILPKRHHVVNLLIDSYHRRYLHSGAQLTQSLLAQSVWILSARSVIRSRIFQCVVCFRHKPHNKIPLMGNLPQARVTPSRPFFNTGIDYGGPFNIKVHNLRAIRFTKAYICMFICLVTKAVHIEVVTDLSTDAFIATLTRFVSRRGLCHNIYSDCGTNFVGANNALQALLKSSGRKPIQEFSSQQGITFHFNPPAAPHQGGLWEGAIKSAKHHLRRVIGEHVLTLSELMTLTTQVEAILNSRPLTPLSNDPSDITALTPGHFLIGTQLVALPEENLHDHPPNRLKHWHLVQALHQRIWKRWHLEYIHTLQQRGKWNTPTENLRIGDLVLVQQPSPPLSWPLARIINVSPGMDNVVRVVHLKTQQGTLTRPAHKVFPLPLNLY